MKKTIIDLFENSVKQYPDNPFLWEKTRDAFRPTTYKEVQQQVYAAGAGLIALGVKKGDNMALLSKAVMLGSSANWPCSMPARPTSRFPSSSKKRTTCCSVLCMPM